MEVVCPPIDDPMVPYLVGIDWLISTGDKGRSKSRRCVLLAAASILFCRIVDCCKRNNL